MKVTEHLAAADKPVFSIEILPPPKGQGIETIYNVIDPLMEFNPPFVDVTYHRQEYVYKKRPDGLMEKTYVRKRPGTIGICAALKERYKVDPVPHLICGGFTKETTEDALVDLSFLGIDNVLVIRGDAVKAEGKFIPEQGGNDYAIDLLGQVLRMNKGIYLDPDLTTVSPSNFCVGVAGYPEKHFEAPNLNSDLKWLKKKVELGADYIVTQMFFDNQKYFEFVKCCREADINIPIIPGIKPITTKRQIDILPSIFHIDIPDDLCKAVESCKDNDQVKQVGVDWAIQQCIELLKFEVPCLHFYIMNRYKSTLAIAKEIF